MLSSNISSSPRRKRKKTGSLQRRSAMKAEKSEQTSESESVGGLQRCMDNFKKKSFCCTFYFLKNQLLLCWRTFAKRGGAKLALP